MGLLREPPGVETQLREALADWYRAFAERWAGSDYAERQGETCAALEAGGPVRVINWVLAGVLRRFVAPRDAPKEFQRIHFGATFWVVYPDGTYQPAPIQEAPYAETP